MHIIREELHEIMNEWNLHSIATKRNSECEKGKPDVMFFMPQMHGTASYGQYVSPDDIQYCMDYVVEPNAAGCSKEFVNLVNLLKPGLQKPQTHIEALELYKELCTLIAQYQY